MMEFSEHTLNPIIKGHSLMCEPFILISAENTNTDALNEHLTRRRKKMSDYERLFSPLHVGSLTLRNRIVMPPMETNMQVGSDQAHAWYVARAKGGVGLIIRGATAIEQLADSSFTNKLKRTVEDVHGLGVAIAAQIAFWGRTTGSKADPYPAKMTPNDPTEAELLKIVNLYAKAAVECRRVGFDGVEPHGAHGFFLSQFFSPVTNTRTDRFGGSLENRMEMGLHIVRAIRNAVDDDCIVLYRHTPRGEGYSLEDSQLFAKELEKAGVDVLDVSPSTSSNKAPRADMAGVLKKAAAIPVIAVGSFGRDPQAAENVLKKGWADLIAIGRGLIADPELPNKLREGRPFIECQECDEKCYGNLGKRKPIGCAQNEKSGKEYLYMNL
jgi:2,4-dienoyl-CoA reductase-like NADH-dependent reductase (Old Yellow Enzyme family)